MGKNTKDPLYINLKDSKKKGFRLSFGNHKLSEDAPYSEFKNDIFCARTYFFSEKETGHAANIIIRGFDGYKKKHLDLFRVFNMLDVIDPMTSGISCVVDRSKTGIETNGVPAFVCICIDIFSDRVEISDNLENSDKIVIKSDLIMKSKKKREKASLKEALAKTIEQNAHSNYQAVPANPMGDTALLADGYKSGM